VPGYSAQTPLAYVRAGGSVASISTPAFDAYNWLEVWVRISGYSGGGGIAQLQFNGDAGTTAYASAVQDNNGAPVTQVAGTAAGVKVSATSITGARALIRFLISNVAGRVHGVDFTGCDQSEAAATAPHNIIGSGIWTNTTQITRITLEGGGVNLLAGSDLAVWGYQGI
jgi:hypothetical protein